MNFGEDPEAEGLFGVFGGEANADAAVLEAAELAEEDADHGAVIVHGHTVVEAVEVRPNRIGIDTGVVFTGNLTCLVLEEAEKALLGPDGLEALPDAAFIDR